jgi:rare lipoprotein A (peptidoglycan hydrolase)
LPRSTLRRALRASALCLTTITVPATHAALATPAAQAAAVSAKRLDVRAGASARVAGRVRPRAVVALEVHRGGGWRALDRARSGAFGRYVLRRRVRAPMSVPARLRTAGSLTRRLGRLNVYRRTIASWYGPGLYGNGMGCGGVLRPGTIGVAHKSLPCGSRLTLRSGDRTLRVRVIDRGPYVAGREFDLTQATARRLAFVGPGALLVAR